MRINVVVQLLLDLALKAVPALIKLFEHLQEISADVEQFLEAFWIVLYLFVILLDAHVNAELLLLHLFELIVDLADELVYVRDYVQDHALLDLLVIH